MGTTINEDGKYTVLNSKYLIQSPWLTVRQDEVGLPNGVHIPDYYVLEYPDWINVIAVTTDNLIIMERQYRHAFGKNAYELPAGIIEKRETPLDAARRELLEETGYSGGQWKPIMSGAPNPGTMNNTCHTFIAEGVIKSGSGKLDPTEEINVELLSRSRVRDLLFSGEIINLLHCASLLKYFITIAE